MPGMIVIARKPSVRNMVWPYKVRIDDHLVGKVGNGTSEAFTVAPGRRVVEVRSGGSKSKKVTVDVVEGGYHVLGTGPTGRGLLMVVPAAALGAGAARIAAHGASAFLLVEVLLILLFTALARIPGLHITLAPVEHPVAGVTSPAEVTPRT